MTISGQAISEVIKKQIEEYGADLKLVDVGTVTVAGDGIATVYGLAGVKLNELVKFDNGVFGLALNLNEDSVGVVVLGDYLDIKIGLKVYTTGNVIEIPAGEAQLGRVINPLGQELDGKGKVNTESVVPVEKIAPGVVERKSVSESVPFGIKIVDAMVPVGRGQRELVIGDRATGKTSLCVDALINQKNTDIVGVYVAIGQKESRVAEVVQRLEDNDALDNTVVVTASASESAALQYLAPYSGCAIAEYFMAQGKDVLIVYDDLTKHAWAYRQISLLLRRPPGREAYPGDVFYLHSRLLERSARLAEEYGGGSVTALPIIETQSGDVSAYIPTNVISITDGQLYLEPDLFNSGIRPAVNTGLSVTRVGSAAQTKAMKAVAASLKIQMAQYQELASFAQFGTADLDATTRSQLDRGRLLQELLKQGENDAVSMELQVSIFYIASQGALDGVEVERIREFEKRWYEYLTANLKTTLERIAASGELSDDSKKDFDKAVVEFKQATGFD